MCVCVPMYMHFTCFLKNTSWVQLCSSQAILVLYFKTTMRTGSVTPLASSEPFASWLSCKYVKKSKMNIGCGCGDVKSILLLSFPFAVVSDERWNNRAGRIEMYCYGKF